MNIKIGRNDPCWCGSGRKYKACHQAFDDRIKKYKMQGAVVPRRSLLKTPEQIEKIKESCKINIKILDTLEQEVREGMELSKINDIVNEITYAAGAIPAPLNYEGFPYSVCTSLNEQVCHGYPRKGVYLEDGDILNIDCSTILDGYFSDSSRMFCIGDISPEKKKLVDTTREAVYAGLEQVKPWGFLGDMGQAVHDYCYERGFSIVREIGGHGVGLEFHEDPWVGYHSKKGTEMLLVPGMIFTIEPMVNMGKEPVVVDEDNGWEIYTEDDMPSAQWEIMVLVTETGHEVLCW